MCRIYNECLLLHEELLKQNLDLCNKCMQEQYNATFHELIKDYYGQIVASQHTGIVKLYTHNYAASDTIILLYNVCIICSLLCNLNTLSCHFRWTSMPSSDILFYHPWQHYNGTAK